MKKLPFIISNVLAILLTLVSCSDDIDNEIRSDETVSITSKISTRMLGLTWRSNAPSGISNSGRNLYGVNIAGRDPIAVFTNNEVNTGVNGDPISMSFDYDITQNVTTPTGFPISELIAFNLHTQGSGVGGYGNNVPGIFVLIERSSTNVVEITCQLVAANNYSNSVRIERTIPDSGTIRITSSDITVNGSSIVSSSIHIPFTSLKVTLTQDAGVNNIDLKGFGSNDLGNYNCNGTNEVCAVYESVGYNFTDLVERNKFKVEWDDTAISSSTVTIQLKKGSRVYDSVTNTPNDGLFDEFGLNFPRVSSNSSGFYVQVSGGGTTLISRTFTVEND